MRAFRNDDGPESIPPSTERGEMIGGRYRVEEVLGTGGMGRVVAARDESGRAVAVKLLVAAAWQQVLVERFFREARAVSRIDSNHVVKVLAVSAVSEATPFIVMERLHGRDLGRRLREEGPLPLGEVADCMVQACDALAASHAAGIVHRDVKPSNLFEHVEEDGSRTLKVLDFGISKARGQQQCEWTLTTTRDVMLGSPPYMSPEHLRDARSVDHRTDVWSLGVVLYQLLTGRLPFDGKSVGQLFTAVLERRFKPLSQVRGDLPIAIERIVDRCLASDPEQRYQSAADVARALAPYASARLAPLVERMAAKRPTVMPAVEHRGSTRLSRAAAAMSLQGEAHTMTVAPPPVASVSRDPALQVTEAVVTPRPSSAPAAAPASAPKAGPFDDAESQAVTTIFAPRKSRESLSAVTSSARPFAQNQKQRRTVAWSAAACAVVVALLASPFALSRSSSQPVVPAAAAAAAAPLPAATVVPPPAATTTAANAADDDVTFTIETPAPKPSTSARAPKHPAPARAAGGRR